jgi:hypothetical protein
MTRRGYIRWVFAVSLGACLALGVGCAGPRKTAPEVDPQTLDDVEFINDYLVQQPVVTVDEAYRAMLILADGEDTAGSFDARRERLESRGIARSAWRLEAENCIDRGSVAYMVMKIMQMRGGVNMLVFGSWGPGDRRYAVRELVYRKLLTDEPAYRYIRGGELASLLREADAIMQKKGLYQMEAVEIGAEPPPGEPIRVGPAATEPKK